MIILYMFKITVVNRECLSIDGGSLEITPTHPLRVGCILAKRKICSRYCHLKKSNRDCIGKITGVYAKNLSILGVYWDPCEFCLMFLSREIDIKLWQIYSKTYKYKILYNNRRFKHLIFSKYAINLKAMIFQKSQTNLGLFLLLFESNNFSFLINIIDITLWIRPYHLTRTPTNDSAVYW